jgi:asparagine synthetase B (glutamine-hydrolysing)
MPKNTAALTTKGIFFGERVHLGHCRLSIIDLPRRPSANANHDRTKWIIFNGEIYNYIRYGKNLKVWDILLKVPVTRRLS